MEESIKLTFREGSSDKVYQAFLVSESGGGYTVHATYGRRGGNMTRQNKIETPTAYSIAKKAYDTLVSSKTRKGYQVDGAPTGGFIAASAPTQRENISTPAQRLNPIEEDRLEALFEDPRFVMQEKMDGKRVIVINNRNKLTACNLYGIQCGIPETIEDAVRGLKGYATIDGEAIGDKLYVFDLLENGERSLRDEPYGVRLGILEGLIASKQTDGILELVPTYRTEREKRQAFEEIKTRNGEGVVFKKTTAVVTPMKGHRDQWKFKFCESVSAIVTGRNTKRSINIGLLKNGETLNAGNVSIPANHEIPEVGTVVEVRYLYAFRESGVLFQPVYLGSRDDLKVEECVQEQLKYKPEVEEAGTAG